MVDDFWHHREVIERNDDSGVTQCVCQPGAGMSMQGLELGLHFGSKSNWIFD